MPDPAEITIIVHNATGLKSKLGGGHKFFVVFGLDDTKFQTEVIKEPDGSPVWNEENVVTVSSKEDEIFFILRQKETVLGQIIVPVSTIQSTKGCMQKQSLQPHKKCNKPQGELTYQCFVSKYRSPDDPLPTKHGKSTKIYVNSNPQSDGLELADTDPNVNETNDSQQEKNPNNILNNHDLNSVIAEATPNPSPRTRSRQNWIKLKERVKQNSQSESICSDKTDSSNEGESEDKKSKKKRFSLNLFSGKNIIEKALGKDGSTRKKKTKEKPDSEIKVFGNNNNTGKKKKKEITDNESKLSDQADIDSDASDFTSASSVTSQTTDTDITLKDKSAVKFYYDSELSDVEEKDQTISSDNNIDIVLESKDQDTGVPDESINVNTETADNIILNDSSEQTEDKSEKKSDLADKNPEGAEPIQTSTEENKSKRKRKFGLGFLSKSSQDVSESEKAKSKSSETDQQSEKQKKRLSLTFLGVGAEQTEEGSKIICCTPNRVPVDEAKKLCIEGFNLGNNKDEILSLKVAGCDCLDTVEFESSSKIYCTTHFQFEGHTGPIEIITKRGGRGVLEDGFTFFDEMEAFTPTSPKYIAKDVDQLDFKNVKGSEEGKVSPEKASAANHTGFSQREIQQSHASKTTDDVVSPAVKLRTKMRRLPRCASEAAIDLHFKQDEPDSNFKENIGRRRNSEFLLRPRRKAPPVPDEDEQIRRARQRGRRASESAVRHTDKEENDDGIPQGRLVLWKNEMERRIKKRAPPPPANSAKSVSKDKGIKEKHARSGSDSGKRSLPPVLEHEHDDTEAKEELTNKITKLEEENAALLKDNTRLKGYIDSLVSRVIDHCPEALLQINSLKTNLFLDSTEIQ